MLPSPFASASELSTLLGTGETTAVALTRAYLDRIRTYNLTLHAVVIENDARALQTAAERDRERDAGHVRGPLHGVPVTVKESFNIAGLKTTANFPPLRDNTASTDATVVKALDAAGACVLGKTNVPMLLADVQTFGPLYPTANNPYDLSRTPGGSTGGGAAAVAAGLTTIEFGSDIGGSLREPAHFCGIFGFKPTENAVLHGEGHVPPLPNARGGFVVLESIGALARTMPDIELAWAIVNRPTWSRLGHLPAKPRLGRNINEYRIAWFDDIGHVSCDVATRHTVASFINRLEQAGARCEKHPFDQAWLDEAYAIWCVLFGAVLGQDASWIVRQVMKWQFWRIARGSRVDASPIRSGLALNFKAVSQALKRRAQLVAELERRFDAFDFVIGPVAAGPAFTHNPRHQRIPLDQSTVAYADYVAPYTTIYNATGNPVLVVPAGRNGDGLPVGLQIAAPHYAEADLLHFGHLVEGLGARFQPPPGY
jgi:amidase